MSASAVGYYGDRGDEKLTEFAGHGEGFLADVSVEWENSLSSLSDAGISITPLRLGLVLSNQGGVLKQLSFPWRLGLGVKIGAGLQWWPWIHIEDAIGLIHHALNGLMPHGPINAIAPEPVTQAEFAKELARVLHRPQIFRIPQFFLRILLGEMSWELTASRLAVSRETGYTFRFNTLNVALNDLLPNGVLNQNGMKRYQTEMWVDAPIDKVFEFFSDPANLEQITPPWLNFKMMTHQPPSIGVGTIIDYRLRLRRIPISWQSEITEWNPPYRFVDVQNKGPYRHWAHTHEFETKNGGTLVKDTVDYKVPGGCIVDKLLVRRDLAHIFEYRQCQLRKIFL